MPHPSRTPALTRNIGHAPTPLRLLRKFGVDRAVGYTLLGRGWAAGAGFVNLFLITRMMSPVQQGFYYTFGSILALTVFFELGLGYVLMQFASHERAHLEWTEQGTLEGDATAKARLASLLRMSLIWYSVVGLLILVTLLPVGLHFFGAHAPKGVVVDWQRPWIWIVLLTSLSLSLTPLFSILEGCGLVAEIISLQFVQNVLASLVNWAVLWHHGALYAAPLGNTLALLWTLTWLWRHKRPLLRDLASTGVRGGGIDWRREIWPFQWRMAVSGASGYFIFQLFNPLLFAYYGAAAAGRMGLCLSVMSAIGLISLGWITTKSATFGSLIAKREFRQMDRLFFPCLWQSWALVSLGALCFWLGGFYLHHIHHPLSLRILAPLPLGLLVLAAVVNHGVAAQALYLRAHKQEPFLGLSIAGACLIGLLSFLLGRPFGATGMMAGYLAVTTTVGLGLGTRVFLKKRSQWHEGP